MNYLRGLVRTNYKNLTALTSIDLIQTSQYIPGIVKVLFSVESLQEINALAIFDYYLVDSVGEIWTNGNFQDLKREWVFNQVIAHSPDIDELIKRLEHYEL